MDIRAETQLRIIGEIAAIAADNRIPLALRDGWALDFLVGRKSRARTVI